MWSVNYKFSVVFTGLLLLSVWRFGFSQQVGIRSGPMAGSSAMQEVKVWLQTTGPAEVKIRYAATDEDSNRYFFSAPVQAVAANAFAVTLVADSVWQGKTYRYQIWINNKALTVDLPYRFQTPKLWQYREEPPPVRIAAGSCAFINDARADRAGKPYGQSTQIFERIADQQPDIMLWLGDNIYTRETDWTSRSGYLYRYTQVREVADLQRLLRTGHHYAIWDDHDYGPNDHNRSFWNRHTAREVFNLFWPNPSCGIDNQRGITTSFVWSDAEFFLLDNRSFRSSQPAKSGEKTILGAEQLTWLLENLRESNATFKFVCMGGQFLSSSVSKENYINYADEQRKIIDFIISERITGVIFLTGDRHFSEISRYPGSPVIYDLTISPLSSGSYNPVNEKNEYRLDSSLISVQNFAILEITGLRKDRKLTVSYYDVNGKLLYRKEIAAAAEWPREAKGN